MSGDSPISFVESAPILETTPLKKTGGITIESTPEPSLDLDKLPQGVVSGNTLIDYSATSEAMRGGLSLALAFANRSALAALGPDADEDDFFAAYKSNLVRLGFNVSQGAFVKSRFKKKGLVVHKAIIPFLTAALGGVGIGPVLVSLLQNLQSIDSDRPWITLFDRETRMFETREMHFAAATSNHDLTSVRHVAARLFFVDKETNVLFFKISEMAAEFESATMTLGINNGLLASIEPALRKRLATTARDFISSATLS
jgi:hypothetical protein